MHRIIWNHYHYYNIVIETIYPAYDSSSISSNSGHVDHIIEILLLNRMVQMEKYYHKCDRLFIAILLLHFIHIEWITLH